MKQIHKILIASLSTGSGHVRTAQAIAQTAQNTYPNIEVCHIDIANHITPLFKKTTISGYDFLSSKLPRVWGTIFKLTDSATAVKAYHTLTDYLKMIHSFDFIQAVRAFEPDHIISTHFVPTEILTHAMKKQQWHTPITEVVTDYGLHPLWVVDGISNYIVSTDTMREALTTKYNIPSAHAHNFGIPIDPVFYETKDIETLRKKYAIPDNLPVILILSGGQGSIQIDKVIKEIYTQIPQKTVIYAVSGTNQELFTKISSLTFREKDRHIYRPIAWTDEIDELIRIASVVVSKPGGLTTTECVTLGTPLIAINPIPGQEEYNVDFLTSNDLGVYAKNVSDITSLMRIYLLQKNTIKKRTYNVQSSANKILKLILTQTNS